MYELIIILCRFLFVFYIAWFLWQGAAYIMDERGIRPSSGPRCVSVQRVTTVFMHLTAFLILAYVPGTFTFDFGLLTLGGLGLAFILCGHFAVDRAYPKSCPLMWNGVFFLMDVGLIMLTRLDADLAKRQLMWFGAGFAAMLLIPLALRLIPRFEKLEYIYLIAAFVLLLSPLAAGVRSGGALNWIDIKGFKFQPSEAVKFLYVFYLASYLRKKRTLLGLVAPVAVSAAIVLVLTVQRDLGGALIFFMTFMALLYISTGSVIMVSLGMVAASAAAVAAYRLFAHVRVRVAAWLDPWSDISGDGYQIVRSLFAIGTWGLAGSGLTRGLPGSVPVAESDFIFAAICEELGSFFGIGLIGVFIMIFYRGAHISLRCERRYYSLLAAGFTALIAFQTFLIIGGVTKLIPITGVTLPFVSYGGSSIVVSVMMIGILQWIYIYNRKNREAGE